MKRNQVMTGIAALGLILASAGCNRALPHDAAVAAAPHPRTPSATAHLIRLPDSAIFVERGSTEDQLAAYLGSPQAAPRTFRFTGREFEPWQSRPNPATLKTMYAVAQILRAYPHTEVTLVGHTDNDGTAERNIRLSQERVDRMMQLLVHGGIQPRRITAVGRGLADPIADNRTEAGRAQNRRIELIVTRK